MPENPDTATKERLLESGELFLRTFHEEHTRDPLSSQANYWRGRLAGLRTAIEAIGGRQVLSEILQLLRDKTSLGIPHVGPVGHDGTIYSIDPEADEPPSPPASKAHGA